MEISTQLETMKILSAAQMEMKVIIAERRVVSLNRNIPPASDRVYNLQDSISVASEE